MANYLNFPFDPELFLYNWKNAEDPTLTAMVESGAVQENAEIANLISTGSDIYTIPFYNVIGGEAENYDGATDITLTATSGSSQVGVVYGRAHGWKAQDFVKDFNSGADPEKQIVSQVKKYWTKQRQNTLIKILNGVFTIADDESEAWDAWQLHTTDLATSTSSVAKENKVSDTTVGDAIQKAVGDNSGLFSMAIMHSKVASNLAGLQLLEYRKYTDSMGIERRLNIADINGMTVIIDDGCPVATSESASGEKEYTTYLFGTGAIQHANASVETPVEKTRDALKAGGFDGIVTRERQTLHPNGFSFVVPKMSYTHSPTDAQLGANTSWALAGNPKNIAMARLITNG